MSSVVFLKFRHKFEIKVINEHYIAKMKIFALVTCSMSACGPMSWLGERRQETFTEIDKRRIRNVSRLKLNIEEK